MRAEINQTRRWLRELPKAELHVHLEGTVSPQTYQRIAERNGFKVPDDLRSAFACSDFASFLNAFIEVVRTFREPEDFADLAGEYLAKSAEDGVRHVEFFFSPATIRYFHKTADLPGIVQAIHAAALQAKEQYGVSSFLIFDMVRNFGLDAALADIDLAKQCAVYGVIGIGLGGDERNFPARDFVKAFERAEKLGLRRTVHAGEAAGADSVQDAIEMLRAERIGHGVAAEKSEYVLESLRDRSIGIDVCLSSNRVTGAWQPDGTHPLRTFLKNGIKVALSTDDPAFFGSTIVEEFERAMQLGLSRTDLARLASNSFLMSFAPKDSQSAWLAELDSYVENGRQ